jgi:S1-C subfamily serine protease
MTKRPLLAISLGLLLAACEAIPAASPTRSPSVAPSATAPAPSSASANPGTPSVAASASTARGVTSAPPSGSSGSAASASASAKPSPSGSAPPSSSGLTAIEEASVRAIQQVGPGVVKITHSLQGGQALGSGTIIDAKGYILTNAHVAEGSNTYQVTLANNQTVQGKLVGLDPFDDLAVIQISQPDLPVVEMGDSSKLQVGQTVLAIGNPIGFTRTVTSGIVSALDRTIPEPPSQITGQATTIPNMIQTSAPINPGNSGGALIDLAGKLVGVPTLAAADPELGGVAQGIAFAVPVNRAKAVIPQLISEGRIIHSGRAFLGVSSSTIDARMARVYRLPVDHGAYLAQVVPNSAAARAGLKQGDIIVKFEGKDIQNSADLGDAILNKKPGDQVQLTVYSGGSLKTVTVTLQEAPANQG